MCSVDTVDISGGDKTLKVVMLFPNNFLDAASAASQLLSSSALQPPLSKLGN